MVKPYRINGQIRVREVRVIDENGVQMGVLAMPDALRLAQDRELDLVEVAPQESPPVCRLLDYGRFRYLQAKKERETRRSQNYSVVREVRFRTRIGQHDLEAKQRVILKLLGEGAKVKVSVQFRGREMTHPEQGVMLLKRVTEALQAEAKLERPPATEGRMMSIMLAPLANAPRKDQGPEQAKAELSDAQTQNP